MAKNLYIADRDFDHFRKGEVVELDEDDPYTRTGYLEPWEPVTPDGPEKPPALAVTGSVDVPREEETDGDADASGAEPKPRPRGRK